MDDKKNGRFLILIGSLLLTVSEWYTFFLVSQVSFFVLSLYVGILIYTLGFIGRVSGSILFGYIGDKMGRRHSIILSAVMIILSTSLILISPSNLLFLVIARTLQGLSLGGEWGAASTILAESYLNSNYRVFILSLNQLSVPLGIILSTFSILVLSIINKVEDWNLFLLLPILLSSISLFTFKDLGETKSPSTSKIPLWEAIRDDWKNILLAIGVKISESSNYYIFTSYVFSESLSVSEISTIVLIATITQLFTMPLFGYLANSFGVKRVILSGIVIYVIGATLFLYNITLAELTLSVSNSALYSPQSSLFVDLFKSKYRVSGTNFSYQLASILGGSMVPSVLALYHLPLLSLVIPISIISLVSISYVKLK
ncbi:MFS transporter [Sulfolobus acidocaldarius]|uniref:Sugar transporter n=4 Tax=Sulfolobus acidocaldarius TaxID=2285 RepID=Q4J7W9_SULAC|nr:MFS transporter [Sulfolobus acidocaldarius]AAY81112.1 sugar transporter [Sulfolobus acidocaldarius DSM 639]AGE71720.1 sugar transporter [Sulfolobus acidocaldarius N8]AGE73993.1 sugar transporter [Sulfolobus acidocaldarius Ron12/I]ALU30075.1 sugar transporter [Sulfolobus acidocaldarius]ALU30765.1 sugar transporter [Sulfolobus acidocaldarius]